MYAEKYQPRSLDALEIHGSLTARLKRLVRTSEDFPHMLFFGPSGAGKQTRVSALLVELFGPGARKLRAETKTFKKPSGADVELVVLSSAHHIEVKPSDVGIYDRLVVREMIKEIASSAPIVTTASSHVFKVVVLRDVDLLSREAQQALRRTMEKYMATCRLILVATTTSKLLEPLRSRCVPIRVPAPSTAEITQVLHEVARAEKLQLPPALAERIAESADGNLRRALLQLEVCRVQQYPFSDAQLVERPHWEVFVNFISARMIQEQSPKRIVDVRAKIYELIVNCIPPEAIIKTLVLALLTKIDVYLAYEVLKWAAHYEHRMKLGSKPVFHIEAFVARFMSLYKKYHIRR